MEPEAGISSTPEPAAGPKAFDRWADIIDSSKAAGGSDSVWKSTHDILTRHSPEELKKLGFDPTKDTLDKWADKKTAELLNDWTKTRGGQSPDFVHDGDKVVMEFDAEGRPHLKIYENEGIYKADTGEKFYDEMMEGKALPKAEEIQPPAPTTTIDSAKMEKIISDRQSIENAAIERASGTSANPFDILKDTYEYATGVSAEKVKVEAVRQYIDDLVDTDEYKKLGGRDISGEKLNAFARMFPFGKEGGAEKNLLDLDSPKKLAEAVSMCGEK